MFLLQSVQLSQVRTIVATVLALAAGNITWCALVVVCRNRCLVVGALRKQSSEFPIIWFVWILQFIRTWLCVDVYVLNVWGILSGKKIQKYEFNRKKILEILRIIPLLVWRNASVVEQVRTCRCKSSLPVRCARSQQVREWGCCTELFRRSHAVSFVSCKINNFSLHLELLKKKYKDLE